MSGAISSLDCPEKTDNCVELDAEGNEEAEEDEGRENSDRDVGSEGRIVAESDMLVLGHCDVGGLDEVDCARCGGWETRGSGSKWGLIYATGG